MTHPARKIYHLKNAVVIMSIIHAPLPAHANGALNMISGGG